jgi:hypothetical protein
MAGWSSHGHRRAGSRAAMPRLVEGEEKALVVDPVMSGLD